MNFFNRFIGVIFSPQETFKTLLEKPVWIDALIVILIAIVLFTHLIMPYTLKDTAQLMENNVKLKERLGDEGFEQTMERIRNPSKGSLAVRVFALTPLTQVIGFLIASLILLVFGRVTATEGKYIQVLSAYIHANLIDKILGNALRLFLILSRKSVFQTSTSLALFFPHMEVTSLSYAMLSQVDFFQLWLFGVLSFGLSYIFKIELKKALFISYGFWLLKSAFNVAIFLVSMSFMG
ncbi:MAG: YIP1 family protein [Candidatus Aminicenantaceae bacterium]